MRRNVIKNVLILRFVKIIRKLLLLSPELLNGIVEHDLVKQMALKVLCLAGFGINIVTAVPQESKVGLCNPGHIEKHIILRIFIKIFQSKVAIAIGHDKARDCAGESPQMRPYFFLDRPLLLFFIMSLQPLNNFLRLFRNRFLYSGLHRCHESLERGIHIRLILRLRLPNLLFCLGLPAFMFQPCPCQLLLLSIVLVNLIKGSIDLLLELALQPALGSLFDSVLLHRRRQDFFLDIIFDRPGNIFQLLMNLSISSSGNRGNLRRHILFDLFIDLRAKQILRPPDDNLLGNINFAFFIHIDCIQTI